MPNESEVFLPDLMHCTVWRKRRTALSGQEIRTNLPARRRFGRDSRSRNFWNSPSIQSNVPLPDPAIDPGRDGRRTGQSGLEP